MARLPSILLIALLVLGSQPLFGQEAARASREFEASNLKLGQIDYLREVDRLVFKELEAMSKDLSEREKKIFYRRVLGAKFNSRSGGFFNPITERITLNRETKGHPLSRSTLVHEAQHLIDHGPGTYLFGYVREILDRNFVMQTEQRAWGKTYDINRGMLALPGFDASSLVAKSKGHRMSTASVNIPPKLFDESGRPKAELLGNLEKYLQDPAIRSAFEQSEKNLRNGLPFADKQFLSQIEEVKFLSRSEFIDSKVAANPTYRLQAKIHSARVFALGAAVAALAYGWMTRHGVQSATGQRPPSQGQK